MKFPYGISDFKAVIEEGFYYCDRSDRIPVLENAGKYLLFIRPRRFGKSLLVSMLHNYYDISRRESFETIFGRLKIGKKPTPFKNMFFILKLDFSCVNPTGTTEEIRKALYNHVNTRISDFARSYEGRLSSKIEVHADDAPEKKYGNLRLNRYAVVSLGFERIWWEKL